jgi:hypothetical protein
MVSSGVCSFTKQAACPSSKLLLDYRLSGLAPELRKLVEWHLEECDFCWAEVRLLNHHNGRKEPREEGRPPAMPVNLRVLAEDLLLNRKPARQKPRRAARR